MQWELLRTFESVARLGSLTSASKALGVSQSTVSRRLSKLEDSAGSPLLLRESPVRLTHRGEILREAIQPMVNAATFAQAALEETPELRGLVTLATVGEWLRWVLAEKLPAFYEMYPHLSLQILASNRLISLAAGEADVALRVMVRPEQGDLVAKKVHTETFGFFASPSLVLDKQLPWLGLAGSFSDTPEQRYAKQAFSHRPPRLLVEDVESLGMAVRAGLGVAVLPKGLAQRLGELVEVSAEQIGVETSGPIPHRDFWMVVHSSKQHIPKVRAVIEWLVGE